MQTDPKSLSQLSEEQEKKFSTAGADGQARWIANVISISSSKRVLLAQQQTAPIERRP